MRPEAIAVVDTIADKGPAYALVEDVDLVIVRDGDQADVDADEIAGWPKVHHQADDREAHHGLYAGVHGTPGEPAEGLVYTLPRALCRMGLA